MRKPPLHPKKNHSSMLSKFFFGFEKIVSNPNKLQIPDMGLKVDCEVYLTRILANDYREKKINEKNPINEKIKELKLKIQNLNERYDNLAVQSLLQRRENKMKSSGINVSSTSSKTTITSTGGSTSSRTTTAGGSLSDSTRSIINGGSSSSSTINGGSTSSTTTNGGSLSSLISGGSSSSSSTTTIKGGGSSSTTLDINSIVPTYTETDGEIDVGDFNRIIATMKALLAASSEKYNTLDSQYQKNLKALTILKAIYGSGKDKECDCDKKLKTCEVNLTQYNTQINTLNITIISLRQQLTECRNNPPKGDCDGLKEEIKKEQERNQICEKSKSEITIKYTTIKNEITIITNNYDNLKIKYDLLVKKEEACQKNISILEIKIKNINIKCQDKETNYNIVIAKYKIEINTCNKNWQTCKDKPCPCKDDPNPNPNLQDGGFKLKYEECIKRESSLQLTITNKDSRIVTLTIEISNRDKTIIDLRSQITTLELNIKNCKTDNTKIINELNIQINILKDNITTCTNEIKTIIIYKTKYEKCDSNCQGKIAKLNITINQLNIKITFLTSQLKECKTSGANYKIEIQKYITIINNYKIENKKCTEKEKFCTTQLNIKITEYTTLIEQHKQIIISITNKFNKNCEDEKKALNIKITFITNQLDLCNKKKDLSIDIKKCEDKNKELNILIINYKKTIEEFTIKLKDCNKQVSTEKNYKH